MRMLTRSLVFMKLVWVVSGACVEMADPKASTFCAVTTTSQPTTKSTNSVPRQPIWHPLRRRKGGFAPPFGRDGALPITNGGCAGYGCALGGTGEGGVCCQDDGGGFPC